MKKVFVIMLALSLTLSAFGAFSETKPVYLALGDSITTGYGLGEDEKSFPEIVADAMGYELVNRAVNGNTAPGIISQMKEPDVIMDVQKADVITITCGGNDLMGMLYEYVAEIYNAAVPENMKIQPGDILGILSNPADARYQALMLAAMTALNGNEEMGITPFLQSLDVQLAMADFLKNMGIILTGIRMGNPNAKIIFATQYNPYRFFNGVYQGMNEAMEVGANLLSSSITAYSHVLGYEVAEVYAAFGASEENLCNADMTAMNLDFHPNARGHEVIADCVLKVLAPSEE